MTGPAEHNQRCRDCGAWLLPPPETDVPLEPVPTLLGYPVFVVALCGRCEAKAQTVWYVGGPG